MQCAVVETASGFVVNMIVADPAKDTAPQGHILVLVDPESPVNIGWKLEGDTFVNPNPEPLSET